MFRKFVTTRHPAVPVSSTAGLAIAAKQVGVSYTGIPIEEIQLTRHVGYGDLTDNDQTCIDRAIDAAITQEKTIIAAVSRK
jgi:hypothetical protein